MTTVVNEASFLEHILSKLGESSKVNLLQGNEDAVAVDITSQVSSSNVLVVNTDSMTWSSDALPPDISLFDFGKKLVTMTTSDVIAKGAVHKYFLSTICFPEDFSQNQGGELVDGMIQGCFDYDISYLGGDLGKTKELVISGIVIGFTKEGRLLKRSSALENDLVCTTGYFGLTGLGYKHYLENDSCSEGDTGLLELVNEKLTSPKAALEWLPLLVNYCHASIDSSDGLYRSLLHITSESNTGIVLEQLPIDPLLQKSTIFSKKIIEEATLFGGEEYEIIFTIPKEKINLLKEETLKLGLKPHIVIGKISSTHSGILYNNEAIKERKHWDSLAGWQ